MGDNIKPCACRHEYQDIVYGNRMRVHTRCNKGYRCTVCNNLVTATFSDDGKKAKK